MEPLNILYIILALFAIEILYFKIADCYNIVDKPNHRSSHSIITIRGGGVLFSLASLIHFFAYGQLYPIFTIGLVLIAVISFIDDLITLDNKARLIIHIIAVILMLFQLNLMTLSFYYLIVIGIFIIGTINAYNFMDGINGITVSYSLITTLTLLNINLFIKYFISTEFLIVVTASLLVFGFYNFRTKAKTFAGDVGSVSIAFIIIFLVLKLIIATDNYAYILLLLIYGLDTVCTIIFRLLRKENIFEAHRTHFYQFLANEKKYSHVVISILYAIVQLLINIAVINYFSKSAAQTVFFGILVTVLFLLLRFTTEGRSKLFGVQP